MTTDDMMEGFGRIMDAGEVAEMMGMDVQMIRKYAREQRIQAYRLPGTRTFKFFQNEVLDTIRNNPVSVEENV
ncbi:MAG: helix-turn-helix domain-containing protein [Acidimicrobiia bacterium]|nr:helix-turn-helix domain-containing protein [Acidimicrobiia bacterium]